MEESNKNAPLKQCLAKPAELAQLVNYNSDSIVSKTLIDKPVGTVTLFAFDAGQKLSQHQAPYDALVQILDGTGQIIIDKIPHNLSAGQCIIMPANVPHAVNAKQKFKMQLTMIRQ